MSTPARTRASFDPLCFAREVARTLVRGSPIESLEHRRLLAAHFGPELGLGAESSHEAGAMDIASLPLEIRSKVTAGSEPGVFRDAAGEFFIDPAPAFVAQSFESEGAGGGGDGGDGGGTSSTMPIFESNPASTKKIFLDFDGHVVSGTPWDQNYNNGNPIHAPPYSIDSDVFNFSPQEIANIEEVWQRVAEDFAPFNVDVTTREPPASAFTAGATALRVMISTDVDDVSMGGTGNRWFSNAGGVAYLGSWRWTSDTPVWVFENNLGNGWPKYVAEAASHEVGHGFDLLHDGITGGTAYYRGHGSGPTGWAPLMGVGYDRSLSQWSKGEYAGANNTEDDLAIITRSDNQVSFRSDDVGNTTGSAANLPFTNTNNNLRQFDGAGIISTRTDVDVWRLDLSGRGPGRLTLEVAPLNFLSGYNNLDLKADLLNSSGTVIQSVNPADDVDAFFDLDLAAGTYFVRVDGVGKGDTTTGYSDYASLGQYEIFGDWQTSTGGSVFQESGGRVDMEAEAFTGQGTGSGATANHTWSSFSDAAAGGGTALVSSPNSGVNVGDSTASPRRDYAINFTNTGTYYVWVRMSGPSGSDDSLHVGMNGTPASFGAQGIALDTAERNSNWFWKTTRSDGARVTVNVASAGIHTFNLWMREDGTRVDQFILTRDANFNPNSGGGAFQESGGRVDFEAEASTGQAPGSGAAAGHAWASFADPGAGGGTGLVANPNSGLNLGDSTASPRRDYAINFTNTGTYYVWVRLNGATGSDDSIHIGVNGSPVTFGAQGLALASEQRGAGWVWHDRLSTGARVTVNVPSAGVRTLNLWFREDGIKVDQFILTRDANFTPGGGGGGGGGSGTVNFENLNVGNLGSGGYTDSTGFRFVNLPGSGTGSQGDLLVYGAGEGFPSKVLQTQNWGRKIVIDRPDAAAFSLASFAYGAGRWGEAGDATVTGYLAGGGTVTSGFSFSSKSQSTLTLNWSTLSRVEINWFGGTNAAYGTVDNFNFPAAAPAFSDTRIAA